MGNDYLEIPQYFNLEETKYNRALRFGLPTNGIEVYDTLGNFIGIVRNES